MSFDTMFPPQIWPPNAGMLSMIEDDVTDRATRVISELERKYGDNWFSAHIITDTLRRYGLTYDMLPLYLKEELDKFNVE